MLLDDQTHKLILIYSKFETLWEKNRNVYLYNILWR